MRFPISDGDILCIDWDERSLRLVEAGVSRAGVKVRAAVMVPMTAASREPADMGEFLRRTLAEHRIRARRVIVDVPRQDAVLNLMTLPAGTTDELAAMVHVQIAKELPFAKDQMVIDFAVSPAADGPSLDVWVTAVRNNVIDYYRQVIQAAGLRPERIGLRPYANLAAVNAAVEPTGRTLLIDIGPSMTEIDVIRDGKLAYSRAATVPMPEEGLVGRGPAAGEEASRPEGMDTLLVEVNRTLGAYRSTDPGAKIDRILLAGTVQVDAAVLAAFQERFGAPALVYDAPASLKWRGAKSASAAPFSSTLGLALSHAGDSLRYFNLLAPKEPEGERRERIRQVPYKAAMVFGLLAVGAAAAYYPVHQKKVVAAGLDARISAENQDKKERDELLKLYGDLKGWQAQNIGWLDQLRRLAEVFPKTDRAYITKIDCREKGEIVVELQARDKTQATDIVEAVSQIREDGRFLYTATPGKADPSKDSKYPVTDRVIIQIRAATKDPKTTGR